MKKYFSLKIDNITVIEPLAIQRGIKGYYKFGKADFIQKLETHPDVNEQVLILWLELPRNATRSVNTNPILDDPILYDSTPVLQPIQKFIARSIQKITDFGNWLLDYIPPLLKVVDKALESFTNLIKKLCSKRETSFKLKELKSELKKFAIQYRIDG